MRIGKSATSSQLRAVFVSHGSDYAGGAERSLVEMVRALRAVAPEIQITVVVPAAGIVADDARDAGVDVAIIPQPWWAAAGHMRMRRRLKCLLQCVPAIVRSWWALGRFQPAVVVTNTVTVPAFPVAAWFRRVPHVWVLREYGKLDQDLTFALGTRLTFRVVRGVAGSTVCCSVALREYSERVWGATNTRVVYPAVLSASRPPRRRPTSLLRVVLVGRIAPAKGQLHAARVLARARALGADVSLTCVGPGLPSHVQQLEALVARLGVSRYFHIAGEACDVSAFYEKSDVALMCSDMEAFGRVTVEAMRHGLPICGIASGGTPEIVSHGQSGYISAAADVEDMAQNLVRLAADEELRLAFAARAYKDAGRFGLEQTGQQLMWALEAAVGSRPRQLVAGSVGRVEAEGSETGSLG
jgi:glycosyltransferase involved in cell wall biosynthesis